MNRMNFFIIFAFTLFSAFCLMLSACLPLSNPLYHNVQSKTSFIKEIYNPTATANPTSLVTTTPQPRELIPADTFSPSNSICQSDEQDGFFLIYCDGQKLLFPILKIAVAWLSYFIVICIFWFISILQIVKPTDHIGT